MKAGKKPTCVHHCLAACMEYGTLEDLAKSASEKGRKVVIFTGPQMLSLPLKSLAAKPGQNYGSTKFVPSKEYEAGQITFKEDKEKAEKEKEKDQK